MRLICLLLWLSLFGVLKSAAYAQNEPLPIIALREGGIYAITPADGSIQVLVAPPENYEDILEQTGSPATIFSADWISPDNRYLAYRTLSLHNASAPNRDGSIYNHRLFLLDFGNQGEQISVPLDDSQTGDTPLTLAALAWSFDTEYLYAVITQRNSGSDNTEWTLLIFEVGGWANPRRVTLEAPDYAYARQLFATERSVVVMDRGIQSPRYSFSAFDTAGSHLGDVEVDASVSPEVNLYINTPFNPLEDGDTVRWGLVHWLSSELNYAIDFDTFETAPLDFGSVPGMISRTMAETSLRIAAGYFDGDRVGLLIRDGTNNIVGEIAPIRAYSFGISGDNIGNTFALAPDGQALAYLDEKQVWLWQDGQAVSLNMRAEALAWGSPEHISISDPAYFAG